MPPFVSDGKTLCATACFLAALVVLPATSAAGKRSAAPSSKAAIGATSPARAAEGLRVAGHAAGHRRGRVRWTPKHGTAGSAVRVRGSRLPKRRKVRISFAGKRRWSSRTGRRGGFSKRLRVPAVRAGRYRVRVKVGRVRLSFAFTVSAGRERTGALGGGTSYYVDPEAGRDANAGTSQAAPWKSLGKAGGARLAPGDRLLLKRGGVWSGGLKLKQSGSPSAPIVIGAYGSGSLPLIRGSCVSLHGSDLVLREVHVDRCAWAGVDLFGDRDSVEQSVATHNVAGVFVHPGATGSRVLDSELRNNDRMSVLTSSPSNDDSGAFGVLLQGERTEVAHNTISGSDTFSYDYGRDGSAIEVYGARGSRVHHNLAVDNDVFSELGSSRSGDNTFAYNVVRSSLASSVGIVTRGGKSGFGPVTRTRLYNNTIRLTGASSQGFVCHGGCSSDVLTMRNNIVSAALKAGYADGPFDEDYDLFAGGRAQFARGSHSRVANPRFADPASGDLRLRAASAAIDRGVSVGYSRDFAGHPVPLDGDRNGSAAVDIGAFEYGR